MNTKTQLPEPECRMGYTNDELKEILGERYDEFARWMIGQTGMICEGRAYNHDTKEYYEVCGGVSHGLITYQWDLERFLEGLPVID